jgi:hypothetical protein
MGDHSRTSVAEGFLVHSLALKRADCTNFPGPHFFVLVSSFLPLQKPIVNSPHCSTLVSTWMVDRSGSSVAEGIFYTFPWSLKEITAQLSTCTFPTGLGKAPISTPSPPSFPHYHNFLSHDSGNCGTTVSRVNCCCTSPAVILGSGSQGTLKAPLQGASYWLASLTVAGFPTGQQLLDRHLDWPLLFTRCQLLDRQ